MKRSDDTKRNLELLKRYIKNEHIKNIYSEGELSEEATIRKNRIVQNEGSREVEREVTFYNLEMILAIGHHISSQRVHDSLSKCNKL